MVRFFSKSASHAPWTSTLSEADSLMNARALADLRPPRSFQSASKEIPGVTEKSPVICAVAPSPQSSHPVFFVSSMGLGRTAGGRLMSTLSLERDLETSVALDTTSSSPSGTFSRNVGVSPSSIRSSKDTGALEFSVRYWIPLMQAKSLVVPRRPRGWVRG